jgi:hypothetical protein
VPTYLATHGRMRTPHVVPMMAVISRLRASSEELPPTMRLWHGEMASPWVSNVDDPLINCVQSTGSLSRCATYTWSDYNAESYRCATARFTATVETTTTLDVSTDIATAEPTSAPTNSQNSGDGQSPGLGSEYGGLFNDTLPVCNPRC